ncbi:hypothetical protein ACIA8G_15135 [Lentzea sp. NPDC051213]|uniref:hypothetical protein n=1 Tax=Lentzea sp. NPDC051213 TaxID=3364126 RepID=UPI0037BB5148
MELKDAMEAATADLDVRPGFVGDVMAGARRRHTRKLVAITAAVALLAGVTAGVVLTRSSPEPQTAADARLTATTTGDLASDAEFIKRSLAVWDRESSTGDIVSEISTDAHVFWAANTANGPASLIVQEVRVHNAPGPQTLVGLVHRGTVVDQEVSYRGAGNERGLYLVDGPEPTYVVLDLGQRVFWSANPVRGPDLRYSREWQEPSFTGGVAVVQTGAMAKPVFVRANTVPAPHDFTAEQLLARQEIKQMKVVEARPGLGWMDVMWASSRQEPSGPGKEPDGSRVYDLKKRGYLDYGSTPGRYVDWEVRAWLPDGRYAVVLDANGELLGALYQPDGTFDRVLPGGPAVKGAAVPVRIALPDNQGTILADRGSLLGPDERRDAWLAPPGTTEVAVFRNGATTMVPLS